MRFRCAALLALLLGSGHALMHWGQSQRAGRSEANLPLERRHQSVEAPLATEAASHATPAWRAVEALIQGGAWRQAGNLTRIADLRVRDPLPELVGCEGFDCVQRYCAFDDGAFSWGVADPPVRGEVRGQNFTRYNLRFTSQGWMPQRNRTAAWVHGLFVFVPDSLKDRSWATLVINMGPWQAGNAAELAVRTDGVAVALDNVPNQWQSFPDDDRYQLDEETLKAWSWVQYVKHADHPEWPIEMPNVKAVVRAMDVVAAFSKESIRRFVVTGNSKRGIATFMAGAVDPRVKAIVPLTISLDLGVTGADEMKSLGGIKRALEPYLTAGTFDLTAEQEQRLHAIIDPIHYAERLTMPKLLMNTGADQFFAPDATRSWWSGLPQPKSLHIFGNCGHKGYSPANDFYDVAEAYINGLVLGKGTPEIAWDIDASTGAIAVRQVSSHTPSRVQVWSAYSPNVHQRDFRETNWSAAALAALPDSGGRSWLASGAPRDGHWVAFFAEFEYPGPRAGGAPWRLSTEVSVLPNLRPFPNATPADLRFRQLVFLSEGRPPVRNVSSQRYLLGEAAARR